MVTDLFLYFLFMVSFVYVGSNYAKVKQIAVFYAVVFVVICSPAFSCFFQPTWPVICYHIAAKGLNFLSCRTPGRGCSSYLSN